MANRVAENQRETRMKVVAVHTITDPDRFFPAAQAGMQALPEGLRVDSLAPSTDGSKAVCVWQAESVDAVRSLVDETVGDASTNEFFEVDAANAIGLPA
jgi:hypothetical protein